jgi:Zn-dependent protease with chaperone function
MDQARSDEIVMAAARKPLRRRVDATAIWQLGILVVVWAGGALIVGFIAGLLQSAYGIEPLVVLGVWTASGVLVFIPPVDRVLARVLLGLRKPTPEQLTVFEGAWTRVCQHAGVRGDRYLLRVQYANTLNASAGAGHIVGVTVTALALPPRYLEAILAHELGHHIGGHAAIGLLHTWYSFPMRTVVRLASWVGRLASIAMALTRPFIPLLALVLLPLLLVSCVGSLLVPLVALPVTVSIVVMRRSELRADGTAVRLGYGPELLALYRGWAARELPRGGMWRSTRAFLRDTHPRFDVRVRALEKAVGDAPTPSIA